MPSSLARSTETVAAAGGRDDTQHNAGMTASGEDEAGHEHSPLLTPDASEDAHLGTVTGDVDLESNRVSAGAAADSALSPQHHHHHREEEFQRTKSVWYLILLTISIGGLQIAWSVELSNGSPYLLSLGLSKSLMALVWIAGPLSGTLVQPYVGMLSDNCRVSWGKRKPFMLGGAAATMVSLLCLAWTREMVAVPLQWLFGVDPAAEGVRTAVIVVAVLWVYVLDFAINTVQAAIRAFILDCAPAHQQEAANAMASRVTGVGNIIGYVAGYANLPRILWWLGDTQFKDLCAIASIALGVTVVLSCVLIRERDPRLDRPAPSAAAQKRGVLAFFAQIFAAMRRLPPQTKRVCVVQFCAWVGFFPMLFYTSSYIGEIYVEPFLEANPHMTREELDALYEQATRVGTFALLIYSITSLCTNVFLPFFIAPSFDAKPASEAPASEDEQQRLERSFTIDGTTDSVTAPKKPWLDYLVIPGFTLRRAWMLSLLLFSGSMFCTVLVRTVAAATVLIGLVGITWALTLWAPWAIISAEISQRDAQIRARKQQQVMQAGDGADAAPADDNEVDQAGVILGIHNMAIAAPQIIATVGSSIIFKFLQKPRGTPGDHSIAVVMALGGITVLLAAYFVHKIDDDADVEVGSGEGPYYAAVDHDHGEASDGEGSEDGDDGDSQPGKRLARRMSSEQLSRASLDRAAGVRGQGYGGGLEY